MPTFPAPSGTVVFTVTTLAAAPCQVPWAERYCPVSCRTT